MKKTYISLLVLLSIAITFVLYLLFSGEKSYKPIFDNINFSVIGIFKKNPLGEKLYINVEANNDDILYKKAYNLAKNLRKEGVSVNITPKENHQSGNLNLYVAKDKYHLPDVIDQKSINILLIPYVSSNDNFEIFRKYDVIIVKSISSYSHLKAVNVRTAFIPDAINIKKLKKNSIYKAMFLGDNKDFSLSLYLAKKYNFDIYGKNWAHTEYANKVKNETINEDIFSKYAIVLTDQSDEEIDNSIVNDKIISILENGGLPFIRYNQGFKHIFQDSIAMYYNETDFNNKFNELTSDMKTINDLRNIFFENAKKWNDKTVANKFIEIFKIMKLKKI